MGELADGGIEVVLARHLVVRLNTEDAVGVIGVTQKIDTLVVAFPRRYAEILECMAGGSKWDELKCESEEGSAPLVRGEWFEMLVKMTDEVFKGLQKRWKRIGRCLRHGLSQAGLVAALPISLSDDHRQRTNLGVKLSRQRCDDACYLDSEDILAGYQGPSR
jgi:hypothetical protein